MKKSEFERRVARECDSYTRSSLAAAAVGAAEAAGVKWDPEEEPLPERIFVWHGDAWGSGALLSKSASAAYASLTWKEALEVARRYNAWEELQLLAASRPTSVQADFYLERLAFILKGESNV